MNGKNRQFGRKQERRSSTDLVKVTPGWPKGIQGRNISNSYMTGIFDHNDPLGSKWPLAERQTPGNFIQTCNKQDLHWQCHCWKKYFNRLQNLACFVSPPFQTAVFFSMGRSRSAGTSGDHVVQPTAQRWVTQSRLDDQWSGFEYLQGYSTTSVATCFFGSITVEKAFLTFQWNFLHLSVPTALSLSTLLPWVWLPLLHSSHQVSVHTGMVPSHLLLCCMNSPSSLSLSQYDLKEQIHHYEQCFCLVDVLS